MKDFLQWNKIMSSGSFNDVWDTLESNFSDQQQREKIEDVAVMLGSVAIAEAVPGFGEVQMALQFLDFIDPYGYNQALNRDSLDAVLTHQYQKIENMQSAMESCFTTGNDQDCKTSGITADMLTAFQQLPTTLQDKRIKSLKSWAVPIDPEVNYPDMLYCSLATSPAWMEKCSDPDYKKLYTDFFNTNKAAYEANAEAARQAAIDAAAAALSGDTSQDTANTNHLRLIGLTLLIVGVLVVFLFYKVVRKVV